jgi:hypothetical protein
MESYVTRDFYLVSYLFLEGNQFDEARLVNQNTTEFTFKPNDKLLKDVDHYYSQTASVNPMSYGGSFRNVKSIIHNLKSGYGVSTANQGTINNVNHKHRNEISRG